MTDKSGDSAAADFAGDLAALRTDYCKPERDDRGVDERSRQCDGRRRERRGRRCARSAFAIGESRADGALGAAATLSVRIRKGIH